MTGDLWEGCKNDPLFEKKIAVNRHSTGKKYRKFTFSIRLCLNQWTVLRIIRDQSQLSVLLGIDCLSEWP